MTDKGISSSVLEDMKQYYDARADEYDEWFYRKERYDHGPEAKARWEAESDIVFEALKQFSMTGDVLELAPGTGIWTQRLVQTAASVTAIDASPRMIEINRQKVKSEKVRYVEADLFSWKPDHQFDGVFFGFWLSHVPTDKLNEFFELVASALKTGGKVFFVDSRPDPTMSATNHVLPAAGSQVMKRILNDGRSFNVIKNFFEPKELSSKFQSVGLQVDVLATPTYFVYGAGVRA